MTTAALISTALRNAYETQQLNEGPIFHSDLGSQYTSVEFTELIGELKMKHSFSYKASPYDNACIDLSMLFKKEEVNYVQYLDEHSSKNSVISIYLRLV